MESYQTTVTTPEQGMAEKRYSSLTVDREPFLKRAREAAQLTIPSLILPAGHTGSSELYKPFQSTGARGVNNIASKLLLTLLPPNSPCFELQVDEFALAKAAPEQTQGKDNLKTKIKETLSRVEAAVMQEIETSAIRVPTFEGLKHLVTAGNVCLYLPKDGGMRVFHLDRYVCKRDGSGNLLEIITREKVDDDMLSEEARMAIDASDSADKSDDRKEQYLYTHVKRSKKGFKVYQEIKGVIVPKSEGTYSEDNFPWMVLRFTQIDGESYGRGLVEEYQGHLYSLEGLTQAIVEGSAASAKLLFLVEPNGVTSARRIAEARNGAIIEGSRKDINTLQAEKQADLRVAAETAKEIKDELAFAFMLNSAVTRNAERVTAEEIRYLAQEVESAQGGIYSILSQEFQLPLIKRLMAQMQSQGRLPKLPKNIVKPAIVTGIEALGRGNDLDKLDSVIRGAAEALGPGAVATYVNFSEYFSRRCSAVGVEQKGLIKTQDDVDQAQQAAQQQSMMGSAVPHAVKAGGDLMKQGLANQQAAAPPQGP